MLLTKNHIAVGCRGELVTFAFGNVSWSLEFDLALMIAAALRFHGRMAKICARDDKSLFAMVGVLTDASAPKTRRQRFAAALPERLGKKNVAVDNVGQVVTLRIGRHTMSFPYAEAQKVAKWLRLRGKEARNTVGERANWARIAEANRLPVSAQA